MYTVVFTNDGWCVNDSEENRVAGPFKKSEDSGLDDEDTGREQAIKAARRLNNVER